MMHAAGLAVPEGLDGRVIEGILTDESISKRPVRVEPQPQSAKADRSDLTEDEERLVEEKLRGLGYL
jgi:hypothetical protein